jgi:PAS domain S-box-containing protein
MTALAADDLLRENEDLRRRLEEAEEALRAIQAGEVDAVLVEAGREQVYTLESPDNPYRLLVAQVPHAAVTLTADGAIIACNRRFADLVRRPPASLRGRPFRDFVAPDSYTALEALLRDGRTIEVRDTLALLRADGTSATTCLGVSALREGALGLCLMVIDLTEKQHYEELCRTQAALRASEERYRTLFESIDEGFCVIQLLFDEKGRPTDYKFLETNPAFDHQTGLRGARGKTIRQLAPAHEEY